MPIRLCRYPHPDADRAWARYRGGQGLALGADGYMTKPFSTKDLVDKVRELLG